MAPIGPDTLERRRQEEGMIIALYIAAAVIMAVGSLYFAWRNRDCRKFLAGAFFVSSGILFYLYLADVSVPLLGTSFVAYQLAQEVLALQVLRSPHQA
jgi:hypothetical protein